jgi:hypothetical protein
VFLVFVWQAGAGEVVIGLAAVLDRGLQVGLHVTSHWCTPEDNADWEREKLRAWTGNYP